MMMKKDKSCGGIIYKNENDNTKWLVIRPKDKIEWWGFPKGHPEDGETEEQTAKREIYEEVGLEVEIQKGYKESTTYNPLKDIEKTVIFFLYKARTIDVKYILDEIQDYKWLLYNEALEQITFENDKELLKKAKAYKNDITN